MQFYAFQTGIRQSLYGLVCLFVLGGCATCEEVVLWGGDPDGYSTTPDDPIHHTGGPYGYTLAPAETRRFDEAGDNSSIVHSFDLSGFGHITGAVLEFEAAPQGAEDWDDAIIMYPYMIAANGASVTGAYLGTDSTRNVYGLWNGLWSVSNSNAGNKSFTIDLTNFPSDKFNYTHGGQRPNEPLSNVPPFVTTLANPNLTTSGGYQKAGFHDITELMNHYKFLDVKLGDDTAVKYFKLTLTSCQCK